MRHQTTTKMKIRKEIKEFIEETDKFNKEIKKFYEELKKTLDEKTLQDRNPHKKR